MQAHHLTGLPNFCAYGRLLVAGQRMPAFTLETGLAPGRYDADRAARIRERSRKTYGRDRETVDKRINERAKL